MSAYRLYAGESMTGDQLNLEADFIPIRDASVAGDTKHKKISIQSLKDALNLAISDGTGTVTNVSIIPANGIVGTVISPTTSPAISLYLSDITPESINCSGTIFGANLTGENTGDQTTITGNAGTATTLQNARNINGVSFNGSSDITITASANTLTGNTLPPLSGENLTSLNGSNIASGTVSAARIASSIARLDSPSFLNVPSAPTATLGTATTQLATTEFVKNALDFQSKSFIIPCSSDLSTAITTGTSKAYFDAPFNFYITEVIASAFVAPTGASIVLDLNNNLTSILSTKATIEAGEFSTLTASSLPIVSTPAVVKGDRLTIDFDQRGSGTAGAGINLEIIYSSSVSVTPPVDTTPPTVTSSTLTSATSLSVTFNESVHFGANTNPFVLTASGGSVTLTYVSGVSTMVFSASRTIYDNEVLTLVYTQAGDGIQDTAGNLLATFSGTSVVNNSDQTEPGGDTTPPTVSSSTLTDSTSLLISFSENVILGADTNVPILTASGGAVVLLYSSGIGTSSVIYSTDRHVYDNETLSLAYTQPGDGLQDESANVLATFTGLSVTNNSEATTIPPPPSANLLARYIAGTGITSSSGRISQWNDQSGNNYHATQATGASQPFEFTSLGGLPVVGFPIKHGQNSPVSISSFLDIPSGLTIANRSCSIWVITSIYDNNINAGTIFSLGSSYNGGPWIRTSTAPTGAISAIGGGGKSSTIPMPLNKCLVGAISSASDVKVYTQTATQTLAVATLDSSYTGGAIGRYANNGVNFGKCDIFEILVYSGVQGSTEISAVRAYAAAKYGIRNTSYTKRVIFRGDSKMDGNGTSDGLSLPRQCMKALGETEWEVFEFAANSNTFATAVAGNTYTDALYSASLSRCILVFEYGTVDMSSTGGFQTPASVYASAVSYASARIAAGFEVFAVCTPSTVCNAANSYNDYLRGVVGNGIVIDVPGCKLIDPLTDSRLANISDTTYFNSNLIDENNEGSRVKADIIAAAILA